MLCNKCTQCLLMKPCSWFWNTSGFHFKILLFVSRHTLYDSIIFIIIRGPLRGQGEQTGPWPDGEASDPGELGRASQFTGLVGWLGKPACPLSKVLIELAHSCGIFWVSSSQHFLLEWCSTGNFLSRSPQSLSLRGGSALTSALLSLRPLCI